MRTIRWKDYKLGRREGTVEQNDDDLCAAWVKGGHAEYAEDIAADDDDDGEDESAPPRAEEKEQRSVERPPVNRSMKHKGGRRK
jgi:hypothetical protein